MIPQIEDIVAGLLDGRYTAAQAIMWLGQHAEAGEMPMRDYFAGQALAGLCAGLSASSNDAGSNSPIGSLPEWWRRLSARVFRGVAWVPR